jgi:hypothetical protein
MIKTSELHDPSTFFASVKQTTAVIDFFCSGYIYLKNIDERGPPGG